MFIIKIQKYIQNIRNYAIQSKKQKIFNDLADAEARYAAGWFGLITSKKWGRESVVVQVAEIRAWQPRNRV